MLGSPVIQRTNKAASQQKGAAGAILGTFVMCWRWWLPAQALGKLSVPTLGVTALLVIPLCHRLGHLLSGGEVIDLLFADGVVALDSVGGGAAPRLQGPAWGDVRP
jgi:hypothetical protein